MKENNNIESDRGFSYKKGIIYFTILITLLITIAGFVNLNSNEDTPDSSFLFSMASMILMLGFLFSRIFPNTSLVILSGNDVVLISKGKREEIPISSISKITAIISFYDSFFILHQYYRVDYVNHEKIKNKVYFKCSEQNINNTKRSFGELLRIEWLRNRKLNNY